MQTDFMWIVLMPQILWCRFASVPALASGYFKINMAQFISHFKKFQPWNVIFSSFFLPSYRPISIVDLWNDWCRHSWLPFDCVSCWRLLEAILQKCAGGFKHLRPSSFTALNHRKKEITGKEKGGCSLYVTFQIEHNRRAVGVGVWGRKRQRETDSSQTICDYLEAENISWRGRSQNKQNINRILYQ